MSPGIAFPWEHDAIGGPKQPIARCYFPEDAARSFLGTPDLAGGAGLNRSHANRPWLACTPRLAYRTQASGRLPDKGNASAIGRPFGKEVGIGTGVKEAQRVHGHV